MASSAEPNPKVKGEDESRDPANVDKIRDILFGGQMRDYERRFAQLEEHLTKDIADVRVDLKKRFDTLEGFIKEEVESVNQKLKGEKGERSAALKELDRALHEAEKTSEKMFTQLEDSLDKGISDLRARLLEQSKTLTADLEGKYRAVSELLDREVKTLQEDKTDRKALGDLFTELAMRLKNEFDLPQGK